MRDGHAFAIAWVAADAGWSVCDGKAAKATDFDSMTGCQRVLHGVKKRVDRQLDVIFGEVLKMFSQFVDEVRAVHEPIVTWEILDLAYGVVPVGRDWQWLREGLGGPMGGFCITLDFVQ